MLFLDDKQASRRLRHSQWPRGGRMPPILSVAGMRHTGSTLLYNILLRMYELKGIDFDCGYATRLGDLNRKKLLIMKTHEFDPRIHGANAFVINMKRDVRDTVASRFRRYALIGKPYARKDVADAITLTRQQLSLFGSFSMMADQEFVYEHFKREPEASLRPIAAALFGKAEPDIIARAVAYAKDLQARPEVPAESQHGENAWFDRHLMSKSHFTNGGAIGGFQRTLRKDEIAAIEGFAGVWLRRQGYMQG